MATLEEPLHGFKLTGRQDFPRWYIDYVYTANCFGVWKYADPDGSTAPPETSSISSFLDWETQRKAELKAQYTTALAKYLDLPENEQGDRPILQKLPDKDELWNQYREYLDIQILEEQRIHRTNKMLYNLFLWVNNSVDPRILSPAKFQAHIDDDYSMKHLVSVMRSYIGYSFMSPKEQVRNEYRTVLQQAKRTTNPTIWFSNWWSQLLLARAYHSREIEGTLAVKDFLVAVQHRVEPVWASMQLDEFLKNDVLGIPQRSLEDLGQALNVLLQETANQQTNKRPAIAARSEGESLNSTSGALRRGIESRSSQDRRTEETKHGCPCRDDPSKTHFWEPESCSKLEFALTGKTSRKIRKPTGTEIFEICERLKHKRYADLRSKLQEKGWYSGNKSSQKQSSKDNSTSISNQRPISNQDLRKLRIGTAMIYEVLEHHFPNGKPQSPEDVSLYVAMSQSLIDPQKSFGSYSLSELTLLDLNGGVHLVNDERLLEPGSLIPNDQGTTVKSGTSVLQIEGWGTRVLKGSRLGSAAEGHGVDFTVTEVGLVKGFHCNIVSKAQLRLSGAWFCGYDNTIRVGNVGKSRISCKLKRMHNFYFL